MAPRLATNRAHLRVPSGIARRGPVAMPQPPAPFRQRGPPGALTDHRRLSVLSLQSLRMRRRSWRSCTCSGLQGRQRTSQCYCPGEAPWDRRQVGLPDHMTMLRPWFCCLEVALRLHMRRLARSRASWQFRRPGPPPLMPRRRPRGAACCRCRSGSLRCWVQSSLRAVAKGARRASPQTQGHAGRWLPQAARHRC